MGALVVTFGRFHGSAAGSMGLIEHLASERASGGCDCGQSFGVLRHEVDATVNCLCCCIRACRRGTRHVWRAGVLEASRYRSRPLVFNPVNGAKGDTGVCPPCLMHFPLSSSATGERITRESPKLKLSHVALHVARVFPQIADSACSFDGYDQSAGGRAVKL